MAARQKYPLLQLRGSGYTIAENRQLGDPIIEICFVDIDRSMFRKNKHERDILKLAKLLCKADEMKK